MSFDAAVAYIKALPKEGPVQVPDDKKLVVYSLYKQATIGDVEGTQPWAVQLEARAKWDAWATQKGKSSDDAKAEYVKVVTEMSPDWQK
jgi:acyl-CoA-binding protein